MCHHIGIVALATIGDEGLIDLVYLVILLAGGQFVGHLLEDGVALGIHTESVIIDGLGIEQVVLHILVAALVGLALHDVQLVLGAVAFPQLDVHIQALLSDQIMHGGLFCLAVLLAGVNGVISPAEQIEAGATAV